MNFIDITAEVRRRVYPERRPFHLLDEQSQKEWVAMVTCTALVLAERMRSRSPQMSISDVQLPMDMRLGFKPETRVISRNTHTGT